MSRLGIESCERLALKHSGSRWSAGVGESAQIGGVGEGESG